MKQNRKIIRSGCFCLALMLFVLSTSAQKKISGLVRDASTGEPLAFSTIGLKKHLSGTLANETGAFDLIIPSEASADTVLIMSFGFRPVSIPVHTITDNLNVKLTPSPIQLQEIDVLPMEAELYVRNAMRKVQRNYPQSPFESLAYYREKLLENGKFIKMEEGLFRTYCPDFLDTLRNQDQLILYRCAEPGELQFMKSERKEKEKTDGKEKIEGKNIDLDLTSSFGGPQSVLSALRLKGKEMQFLDTTMLKEYRYSFSRTASSGDLIAIDFKSKGKVEHLKEEGVIYIDPSSFAIVKVENQGKVVIPVLLRPVLYLYRLGIENPTYARNFEYQQVSSLWYPRNCLVSINLNLTRRHWFSKNEEARMQIEQAYFVNQLKVENARPIAAEKKFDSSKGMKDQVHNDGSITWSQVNILKM